VCPGDQQTRTVLDEMDMEVRGVFRNITLPNLGPVGLQQYNPANSCSEVSELYPGWSSGKYWVRSHKGTAVQVYCDMDRVCGCNSTGGWMRIVHLNMSNASQQCPAMHHSNVQMHGDSSQLRGGCVDETQLKMLDVTLQYSPPTDSSIAMCVGGCVLPTSTQVILHNSVQVHGDSS